MEKTSLKGYDMTEKCENCKYWFDSKDYMEGCGICRKLPPVMITQNTTTDSDYFSTFPSTENDNWCGEFKPDLERIENRLEANGWISVKEKQPDGTVTIETLNDENDMITHWKAIKFDE